MNSDGRDRSIEEIGAVEQVVPGDAPSENYLVVEHLQRMPAVFSRGIVYIVLLFLVTVFLYSVLCKVDVVVEPKGQAWPASHMVNVLCDRDGYVEQVFVSEGQIVKEGSPLFLIRSRDALSFGSKVEELRNDIPLKEKYYDTNISSSISQLEQVREDHLKVLRLKDLAMEQNALNLESIESEISYAKKEVVIYHDMFDRISNLYSKGIISMREKTIYQLNLEKARTEIEKLKKKREVVLREGNIINEEIEKENTRYATQKSVLEKEIDKLRLERQTAMGALRSELNLSEKMLTLQGRDQPSNAHDDQVGKMIRAQTSGTVSELRFRSLGDYVQSSDLLCTILPADQPLYIDITVANKDIGFIKPGMVVKYKFDAFPYIDHGILSGKVLAVSPSAVQDNTLGMVYHVKGDLDQAYFTIDRQRYPIKAGMTATAEIVVKRKSLFAILFKGYQT